MTAKQHVLHGRDHRRGGIDPIGEFGCCPGDWIEPTLTSPWEAIRPFKYRWGCHSDDDGIEIAGLQFTGYIGGGSSSDPIFTLPVDDRPDDDRDFDVTVYDEDDEPVGMAAVHIDASTGAVTPIFPIGEGISGIEVSKDGTDVTATGRPRLHFHAGTGITITAADDTTNDEVDVTIAATAQSGIEASKNDSDVTAARRNRINFKEGSNVTLTVTDDAAGDEVEVTIASTGGGGGGGGVGVTEEKAYVEQTSAVNITATAEGSATSIVAMTSDITVDGTTALLVEFYARGVQAPQGSAGDFAILNLHESTNGGSSWSDLGRIGAVQTPSNASTLVAPIRVARRRTPAAGTVRYRIVAWANTTTGTPVVQSGAGGASTGMPIFLRVMAATARGLLLIEDKLLVADAASFDFTSIAATYKHLRLIVQARSTRAGAANDWMMLRLNNDSGANYVLEHEQAITSSMSLTEVLGSPATSFPYLSELPAATSPAGYAGHALIEIPNYAGTTFHKTVSCMSGSIMGTSSGQIRDVSFFGAWRSTAAINRLTLLPTTGPNFLAGSRATLYGYA